MPFWPFKKQPAKHLTPAELRDTLVQAAASGSKSKLLGLCKKYKQQVTENVSFLSKMPDELAKDDETVEKHIRSLILLATTLAECGSPELMNHMEGSAGASDNPFALFKEWVQGMSTRLELLEFEAMIEEGYSHLERAKTLRGNSARQHEAMVNGRIGELLFHSGQVDAAAIVHQNAYDLCVEIGDVEGQYAYLNCLLETHKYLDDGNAVSFAEKLVKLDQQNSQPTEASEKRVEQLKKGIPLCRLTCVHNDEQLELDELKTFEDGNYQFLFCRNRLSLQKATTLSDQGKALASAGNLADGLQKFAEASEVDPHDPDPVYQSGVCLMELGAYAKAREAFEEVERLAPGWFRCRHDRWLAAGLESGEISSEQFDLLRVLDDGQLQSKERAAVAKQAIERFPDFAPLHLITGDLCRDSGDMEGAEVAYWKGLDLVEEPDLESRLLCALAGTMPADSPERTQLVQRAIDLKGSLMAIATARLLSLPQET